MLCIMQIPCYKWCMIKLSSFQNKTGSGIYNVLLCTSYVLSVYWNKYLWVKCMYMYIWYTYFTNHLLAVECVKIWCWLISPIQNVVHRIILKNLFLHAWWWIAMVFFFYCKIHPHVIYKGLLNFRLLVVDQKIAGI